MSSSPTTLQFIAQFRALHEKARKGTLADVDRPLYASARRDFVRMIVVSQIGVTGQTLRSDLRMAKMLKVEVRPDGQQSVRTTTLEIAAKGFAVMLATPLPVGSSAAFTLFLPRPASPIAGAAKVASCRTTGAQARISFTFEPLPPVVAEALDIVLIDAVLERLASHS